MSLTTTLSYNDQTVTLVPGKMTFFDELYVDFKMTEQNNSIRLQLAIHPKQKITLKGLKIEKQHFFQKHERIFCNGYQSWSESREYDIDEKIPRLKFFARPYLKYYGDAYIDSVKRGKGHFHSWTYGYVRNGNQLEFIGSLGEHTAFTLLQFNTKKNTISIEKECKGLVLEHSFPILDVWISKGKESQVFEDYFKTMNIRKPHAPPITGWTSWYNYYNKISEEIILKNVTALADKDAKVDVIQIDDGYQKAIGDWLQTKSSFPNGMAPLAQKIKAKGFKAGLWLAPFVCDKRSDIFKTKKNWLVKDKKGKLIKAGYNPLWGGWFYVLDFYKKEVQDYLISVFKTVLDKWGYDLVKLDFLYAACIHPPPNKTRGQLMNDAMQFLRNSVGNKWILACGVPLGSAFGKVDYCRIGADIHLQWEHSFLKLLGNRERVSTILSLRTTLCRWRLNNRVFHNDPDVILLRNQNIQLSPTQQYTILLINTLLGNLIFTSDYVADYSEEQWAEFLSIYKWKNSRIESVERVGKDLYKIRFNKDGKDWVALCNLTLKNETIQVQKTQIHLEPYESFILKSP